MKVLKRVLAGTLSLCMAGSMLASCGSTDDSSSKSGSNSANGNGDSKASTESRVDTTTLHGKESSEKSKKTLNIYCWNTEFKSRLDKYYPMGTDKKIEYNTVKDDKGNKVKEIKSIDGVEINWVQIENEGNAYQTKLDEALKKQKDSDDKVVCS